MKTHSITRRLFGIILLAEFAAAVAFSTLAIVHEERVQRRALDIAIQGRADSLLGAVQDLEDQANSVFVDTRELQLPSGDRWQVFNPDGTPLSTQVHPNVGAPGSTESALPALEANDGFHDRRTGGVATRVLQYHGMRIIDREETHGAGIRKPVILVYATPEGHLLQNSLKNASFYILAALLVSACTAAGVAVFLRASLKPVGELTRAAEQLSVASLRFDVPPSVGSIAELQPLAAALATLVHKLRAALEREKRFAGDAAHELKTAVAVLRSTIQVLMMRSRTPEEHRAGLGRALEDTERLEGIVMQILHLAQGEASPAGGTAVLAAAVQTVLQEVRPLALRSNVDLAAAPGTSVAVAMAQDQAEVLLRNLLSNAIQHSRPHTTVYVAVQAAGGTVQLTVRDEGEGIPAEALPHIFERFYRADPSRSRQTGGTGLGLAICKSIVDRAGGTLQVSSQPGVGTLVTAAFPAAQPLA